MHSPDLDFLNLFSQKLDIFLKVGFLGVFFLQEQCPHKMRTQNIL
jgi:hypothetical protein